MNVGVVCLGLALILMGIMAILGVVGGTYF